MLSYDLISTVCLFSHGMHSWKVEPVHLLLANGIKVRSESALKTPHEGKSTLINVDDRVNISQTRVIWTMHSNKCPLLRWNDDNLWLIKKHVFLYNKENCRTTFFIITFFFLPFFLFRQGRLHTELYLGIIPKCSLKIQFSGSLNLFKVNFLLTFWFSIQEVEERESQWLFRFADFIAPEGLKKSH